MGRPTICTLELAMEIAGYIREIGFVNVAVAKAGINRDTHYTWMEKGEQTDDETSPYRMYADIIKKAQADFQAQRLKKVIAAESGWQGSAWALERSDPEQFAIRSKVEHSGQVATGTAPILTPAELDERYRAIRGDRGPH